MQKVEKGCFNSRNFGDHPEANGTHFVHSVEKSISEDLRRNLVNPAESHQVRWRAAKALGESGNRDSIPALSKALKDESAVVRWEAATALGVIGSSEAIGDLTEALKDQSYRVRKRAALSLMAISKVPLPKREYLDDLISLLPSGDERVIEALLQVGAPAKEALISRLDDDSFFVRQDSARVLARSARTEMERRPRSFDFFGWLNRQGWGPKKIATLYGFRTTRENGLVKRVEYTRLDEISSILFGGCSPNLLISEKCPHTGPFNLVPFGGGPVISLDLESLLADSDGKITRMGRTLVIPRRGRRQAIKLALREGDEAHLLKEAQFQEHLNLWQVEFELKSRIPRPAAQDENLLFHIQNLPSDIKAELGLKKDPLAMIYSAGQDYFTYLNDPAVSPEKATEGLVRCAHDLARLARFGFIHDALVPLFHNREQTAARSDLGIYRWWSEIPGRLDRWCESCSYPNLRLSGIADFEHFQFHNEITAQDLQHHLGDHLLSMSLVLGSHFRARGEFDEGAMSLTLNTIFETYYRAFVRSEDSPLKDCIDWDHLAQRMREEMEGDRYMTGLIRGGGPGGADLVTSNGPHLGIFGGFFPIPELVKAIHLTTLFAVLEVSAEDGR